MAKKKKVVIRKHPADKIKDGLKEALKYAQELTQNTREWKAEIKDGKVVFNHKPNLNVHHLSHYGGADNLYETIKVARAKLTREEFIGAMKFTVMKYNDRALYKGNEVEDYEKGLWYQTELVKRARED